MRRIAQSRPDVVVLVHGLASSSWFWQNLARLHPELAPFSIRGPGGRDARIALDAEQLARSLEIMGLAAMPDYRAEIPRLHDRLALLAGADDAKFVAIAQTLSAASFDTIAGSGHDPTLEQPVALAHAIARAVRTLR